MFPFTVAFIWAFALLLRPLYILPGREAVAGNAASSAEGGGSDESSGSGDDSISNDNSNSDGNNTDTDTDSHDSPEIAALRNSITSLLNPVPSLSISGSRNSASGSSRFRFTGAPINTDLPVDSNNILTQSDSPHDIDTPRGLHPSSATAPTSSQSAGLSRASRTRRGSALRSPYAFGITDSATQMALSFGSSAASPSSARAPSQLFTASRSPYSSNMGSTSYPAPFGVNVDLGDIRPDLSATHFPGDLDALLTGNSDSVLLDASNAPSPDASVAGPSTSPKGKRASFAGAPIKTDIRLPVSVPGIPLGIGGARRRKNISSRTATPIFPGFNLPRASDDAESPSATLEPLDDMPEDSIDVPDASIDASDIFDDMPDIPIDAPDTSVDIPEPLTDVPKTSFNVPETYIDPLVSEIEMLLNPPDPANPPLSPKSLTEEYTRKLEYYLPRKFDILKLSELLQTLNVSGIKLHMLVTSVYKICLYTRQEADATHQREVPQSDEETVRQALAIQERKMYDMNKRLSELQKANEELTVENTELSVKLKVAADSKTPTSQEAEDKSLQEELAAQLEDMTRGIENLTEMASKKIFLCPGEHKKPRVPKNGENKIEISGAFSNINQRHGVSLRPTKTIRLCGESPFCNQDAHSSSKPTKLDGTVICIDPKLVPHQSYTNDKDRNEAAEKLDKAFSDIEQASEQVKRKAAARAEANRKKLIFCEATIKKAAEKLANIKIEEYKEESQRAYKLQLMKDLNKKWTQYKLQQLQEPESLKSSMEGEAGSHSPAALEAPTASSSTDADTEVADTTTDSKTDMTTATTDNKTDMTIAKTKRPVKHVAFSDEPPKVHYYHKGPNKEFYPTVERPSSILNIDGAPREFTEEEALNAFPSCNTCQNCRMCSKKRKMSLNASNELCWPESCVVLPPRERKAIKAIIAGKPVSESLEPLNRKQEKVNTKDRKKARRAIRKRKRREAFWPRHLQNGPGSIHFEKNPELFTPEFIKKYFGSPGHTPCIHDMHRVQELRLAASQGSQPVDYTFLAKLHHAKSPAERRAMVKKSRADTIKRIQMADQISKNRINIINQRNKILGALKFEDLVFPQESKLVMQGLRGFAQIADIGLTQTWIDPQKILENLQSTKEALSAFAAEAEDPESVKIRRRVPNVKMIKTVAWGGVESGNNDENVNDNDEENNGNDEENDDNDEENDDNDDNYETEAEAETEAENEHNDVNDNGNHATYIDAQIAKAINEAIRECARAFAALHSKASRRISLLNSRMALVRKCIKKGDMDRIFEKPKAPEEKPDVANTESRRSSGSLGNKIRGYECMGNLPLDPQEYDEEAELAQEIREVQEQIDDINSTLETASLDLEDKEDAASLLEEEVAQLEENLNASHEALKRKNHEVSAMQESTSNGPQVVEDLKDHVAKLQAAADASAAALKEKEHELSVTRAEIQTLQQNIEALKMDLHIKHERLEDLQQQLANLRAFRAELCPLTAEQVIRLQSLVDSSAAELRNKEAELLEAQERAAELQISLGSPASTLAEKEAKIGEIKGEISQLQDVIQSSSLGKKEAGLQELQDHLHKLKDSLAAFNVKLAEKKTEMSTLGDETAELKEKQDEVAKLQEQISELSTDMDTAKTDIQTRQAEINAAKSSLKTAEDQVEEKLAQVAELEAEASEIKSQLSGAGVTEIQAQVADLEAKVKELKAAAEEWAANNDIAAEIQHKIEAMETDLGTSKANVEHLTEESNTNARRMHHLMQDIRMTLNTWGDNMENSVSGLSTSDEVDFDSEITPTNNAALLQNIATDIDEFAIDMTKRYDNAVANTEELTLELDKTAKELADLRENMSAAQDQKQELEETLFAADKKLLDAEKKLLATNNACEAANKRCAKLAEQNAEHVDQLRRQRRSLSDSKEKNQRIMMDKAAYCHELQEKHNQAMTGLQQTHATELDKLNGDHQAALAEQKNALGKEWSAMHEKFKAVSSDLEELAWDHEICKMDLKRKTERLLEVVSEYNEMSDKVDDLEKQKTQLTAAIAAGKNEIQQLKTAALDMQNQLNEARASSADWKAACECLERKTADLEAACADALAKYETTCAALTAASTVRDTAINALAALRDEMTSLRADLGSARSEIAVRLHSLVEGEPAGLERGISGLAELDAQLLNNSANAVHAVAKFVQELGPELAEEKTRFVRAADVMRQKVSAGENVIERLTAEINRLLAELQGQSTAPVSKMLSPVIEFVPAPATLRGLYHGALLLCCMVWWLVVDMPMACAWYAKAQAQQHGPVPFELPPLRLRHVHGGRKAAANGAVVLGLGLWGLYTFVVWQMALAERNVWMQANAYTGRYYRAVKMTVPEGRYSTLMGNMDTRFSPIPTVSMPAMPEWVWNMAA